MRASLHASHPLAVPAASLDAAEPALHLTRVQLLDVMCIVSAHHRVTAAGPPSWTFEMIRVARQSSDAALDVTLELVNHILSGELPREAVLYNVLLIGLEKPGGNVRPIAISETRLHMATLYTHRVPKGCICGEPGYVRPRTSCE